MGFIYLLQEDSEALNSDSAEEVAWTPTRGPGPAHTSMPQPPSPFPVVGHETAAAVNLLSMSIHGHEHDLGGNRGAGAAFAGRDGSLSYDNQQVGIMSEHKYLVLCSTRSSRCNYMQFLVPGFR